jgi:predicted AAA+ superfamily ATPase
MSKVQATILLPFIDQLELNLKKYPQFIQVLLGPRQVGKTTTILHFLEKKYNKKFIYHSADRIFSGEIGWLSDVWQKARRAKALLVIDEIQKVENWAEHIKKFWDEEKQRSHPIQCVLLGSSSLDLHLGLSESLTGRFQMIQISHWNFKESLQGYSLSFEEYLKVGGYPGSYCLRKNLAEWKQYVQSSILETVIEKDILWNRKVKSPALFRQTFNLLTSYPAQEISYTKLLGQMQKSGNVEIVKNYIQLFEGAYLIKALEKFSTTPIRKRGSSPKILPLCPAISFLQDLGDLSAESRGRFFELIVGATLLRTGYELMYWREGPHEVDYVLKFGKKLWAIEVKSGRSRKFSGLSAFIKRFSHANTRVIDLNNYQHFEENPRLFLE